MKILLKLDTNGLRWLSLAPVVIALSVVSTSALAQTPAPASSEASERAGGFVAVGFGGTLDNTAPRPEWQPNVSLHIGGFVSPRWSLRLEVDFPGATTSSTTVEQTSSIQQPICNFPIGPGQSCDASTPGVVIRTVEGTSQEDYRYTVRQPTFAGLVGFEHRVGSRVRLMWLGGGVVGYRMVESSSHYISQYSTGEFYEVDSRPSKWHEFSGGVEGGVDATIRLTRRLELVPNVRFLAVGADVNGGTLVKTGVSVRWYF